MGPMINNICGKTFFNITITSIGFTLGPMINNMRKNVFQYTRIGNTLRPTKNNMRKNVLRYDFIHCCSHSILFVFSTIAINNLL